ncbi:DNA polymerase I, partial [bacterium]|nr:DNA polymerase I [bacterium]
VAVKERFGVPPETLADFLTIVGDASDNLPGIKGVGPKAAIELINRFGSLDSILENIERIGNPRLVSILSMAKNDVATKRKLVLLSSDIPLEIGLEEIEVKKPDTQKLLAIFLRHEFGSLIKEFGLNKGETTSYAAFSELKGKAISIIHKEDDLLLSDGEKSCRLHFFEIEKIRHILIDERIQKYGYNLKSLLSQNIRFSGKLFDVEIASYLLTPGPKHSLEDIVMRYLPSEDPSPKTIFLLKERLEQRMKDEDLIDLFYEIEMPLIKVLADMEIAGISVNKEYLSSFGKELEVKIASISEKIYETAGESFNLNSPKQLSAILFEKLGLPPGKQIKTGYSTDEEVLISLSNLHPLPRLILEYRELAKLKSTYIDGLLPLIDAGGKVHTSFNQTVTATGRLSCRNPNLQNIPVRSELGKGIRKAFVAEEGKLLLSCDYSQIELRILAHLSGDELLIESFIRGEDIHTETAARIYNIDPVFVTPAMRRQAKAVNFGIVYGMGSYGLAKEIGISQQDAKEMIAKYFGLYKGVAGYIEETKQLAREGGYAETMLKRKRHIPELGSKNRKEKEFGERVAVNMPIQGSAADLIKKAMIRIAKNLPSSAKMLLQVHDELIFEIEENSLENVAPIIIDSMQNVVKLKVPLIVNISSSKNWGEL